MCTTYSKNEAVQILVARSDENALTCDTHRVVAYAWLIMALPALPFIPRV